MVYKMALYKTTCYIRCAAVCIYVVWSILRIIFQHKYYASFPYGAFA